MSRTDVQVNFRMPAELKARLEQAAKENHRSVTAELVARLEESFGQATAAAPSPLVPSDEVEQIAISIAERIRTDLRRAAADAMKRKREENPKE